jgi:AAA+ ATPase superfamily predicted ATPase
MANWGFYGRRDELEALQGILRRERWFFVKITGRRRIGKTALIQHALQQNESSRPIYYVQIPDSGEAGVISAVNDALETFRVPQERPGTPRGLLLAMTLPQERYPRPRNLAELAKLLESMAEDGYVVVLDEFQYFNRKGFEGFCSLLQAASDRLAAKAERVRGGWVVLGSIHTEMTALLEDRSAPLYNRVTDQLELNHLDIASVLAILIEHSDPTPERLLFLWTLFEGVPKFYRDCYEQNTLKEDRGTLLRKMFFESSSPLRTEAETWFLGEIGGKADTVLKFVARNPGMMHNELVKAIQAASGEETENMGSYLKKLTDRYRLSVNCLCLLPRKQDKDGTTLQTTS